MSSFISLGSSRNPVNRIKIQMRELIPNYSMVKLYEQRIKLMLIKNGRYGN